MWLQIIDYLHNSELSNTYLENRSVNNSDIDHIRRTCSDPVFISQVMNIDTFLDYLQNVHVHHAHIFIEPIPWIQSTKYNLANNDKYIQAVTKRLIDYPESKSDLIEYIKSNTIQTLFRDICHAAASSSSSSDDIDCNYIYFYMEDDDDIVNHDVSTVRKLIKYTTYTTLQEVLYSSRNSLYRILEMFQSIECIPKFMKFIFTKEDTSSDNQTQSLILPQGTEIAQSKFGVEECLECNFPVETTNPNNAGDKLIVCFYTQTTTTTSSTYLTYFNSTDFKLQLNTPVCTDNDESMMNLLYYYLRNKEFNTNEPYINSNVLSTAEDDLVVLSSKKSKNNYTTHQFIFSLSTFELQIIVNNKYSYIISVEGLFKDQIVYNEVSSFEQVEESDDNTKQEESEETTVVPSTEEVVIPPEEEEVTTVQQPILKSAAPKKPLKKSKGRKNIVDTSASSDDLVLVDAMLKDI